MERERGVDRRGRSWTRGRDTEGVVSRGGGRWIKEDDTERKRKELGFVRMLRTFLSNTHTHRQKIVAGEKHWFKSLMHSITTSLLVKIHKHTAFLITSVLLSHIMVYLWHQYHIDDCIKCDYLFFLVSSFDVTFFFFASLVHLISDSRHRAVMHVWDKWIPLPHYH